MIERDKNPREVGNAIFTLSGPTTQFVGWISLSAESLHNQFTIGRYGNRLNQFCRADILIRRVVG